MTADTLLFGTHFRFQQREGLAYKQVKQRALKEKLIPHQ